MTAEWEGTSVEEKERAIIDALVQLNTDTLLCRSYHTILPTPNSWLTLPLSFT